VKVEENEEIFVASKSNMKKLKIIYEKKIVLTATI